MLRIPETCTNYALSVDAEGDVVLACGGRTLHSCPYSQTVPLLPLGRPERLRLLPKRPANFPLGQDFFHSPPCGAQLEKCVDNATLAGENASVQYLNRKEAKRLSRLRKLGKEDLRLIIFNSSTKKGHKHLNKFNLRTDSFNSAFCDEKVRIFS
jgi:hypothetical protein